MLKHRLFFGAMLIALFGAILYLDHRYPGPLELGPRLIRHEGLLTTLVLGVLSLVGTLEMCRLAESAGHAPLRLWCAISNYLLTALPYLVHNRLLIADPTDPSHPVQSALVVAFLGAAGLTILRGRTERAIADLAVTLLIILYLGFLPTFLIRLRLGDGAFVGQLVYFIAVVKSADIGAYFTGYFLGRHKLIPWLSPKKTIEGFIGGVAFSMFVAFALARWTTLLHSAIGIDFSDDANRTIVLVFGLLMALVGQAGDLLESLFKRDAQIKDSGAILPAFGGVLDLLDSLLPTAPLACWILLK